MPPRFPISTRAACRRRRHSTASGRAGGSPRTSRPPSPGHPLQPFSYETIGGVCSLGRYKGVAIVKGLRCKGFLGWFLHRSYHLLAMPTWTRRVKIAMDWTVALLFPRDLAQLGSLGDPREPFQRASGDAP